jgi:hypothetical protein
MKRTKCCDCGKTFLREVDEEWKTRCVPCFKKSKRTESLPADSHWRDRATAAEERVLKLERQVEQQAKNLRVLTAQIGVSKPALSGLDKELSQNLRSLIQLVHPDKHGGSESANRTTQWLLNVKRRLPCA